MIRFLVTLALALAGGALFTLIHSPLPWLLGPMVFSLLGARLLKTIKPLWPSYLRDTAMIIIGYSIGLSFTMETLKEMGRQLPTMILMTVLLLLFSALIGYGVAKVSGLPLPTVLMGSVPGGLSQMILLAEETEGIDLTVMTFLQVSRVIMIIFCVPLLVFSPLFGGNHQDIGVSSGAFGRWEDLFPGILLFAVVCVAFAMLAKKIRFPSAYLLGPMIATAILHVAGVPGPALPASLLDVSQLLIGTYVGLLLRPESLTNKFRVISLSFLSGAVLILGSLGLSALLTQLHGISSATAFLSMAPGGMDQMGIIAKEIDADIAVVSCYQLFRTWFIYFAVPPILRLAFKRIAPRAKAADEAAGGR
ncbi:AbrB family transcriptional regulator [Paenibacillus doosanensis]|uniref:AbrB family transcriptional regulator n=1 Tax=Paenibacillus doosanensis TaxID=1229154 RepID=UPI00217F97D1|nr:AbrB family transcriptional regulator [Paenibacillus doosanensis]MCS7460542.1 AbrB family transcriptional regulator [Paenibacillus doosanensis]